MKAVTEFPAFTLTKANQIKATLAAEGKNPDEIKENLGQNFKLEGEKLGHFVHSLEVAVSHSENLKRVIVVKLNEGEVAPPKAVKVEEHHYIPEFLVTVNLNAKTADKGKGGHRGGGRGKSNAPKGSPWGLSPEEKAAKNKKPVPAN